MDAVKLRPHPSLLRRGVASALAFFVPAFGVLYFLTVPNGPWLTVLVAQAVLTAIAAMVLRAYLRLGVWVSPTDITEQGFFTRSHYERAQLGEAIFVNTFHGGWIDTVPQLFICDGEGKQLLRLRGQFWSQESMLIVVSTLELPFTEIGRDVSTAELRAAYPGLLYWFERRPALAWALLTGVVIVAGAALFLILRALRVVG